MEDCDQSKVFVGGISWETTEDVLREHFGSYGTVVGSVIAKDRVSGTPRGFAFVSFSDSTAVDRVLLDTHNILGRTVEVKKAVPRSEQNQNQPEQNRGLNRNCRSNGGRSNDKLKTKKIFVGGLSANLTEEEFKIYFEKFGRITDVVVMHDPVTRRPRGFGFITFDSEDSVEEVTQKSFHELSGKLVEVKRAVPKEGNGSTGSNGYNSAQIRDSNFSSYQHGTYPPYSPRYEILSAYGPLHGYGGIGGYTYGGSIFGGGYPIAGYGGINYGMAPISPRAPWSGPAMVATPSPYGNPAMYPAYLNGGHGLMGMVASGYNGIVGPAPSGKSSQFGIGNGQVERGAAASETGRGNVNINYLGSPSGEPSKQNQSGIEGNSNTS